jgi:hypothetical protein
MLTCSFDYQALTDIRERIEVLHTAGLLSHDAIVISILTIDVLPYFNFHPLRRVRNLPPESFPFDNRFDEPEDKTTG